MRSLLSIAIASSILIFATLPSTAGNPYGIPDSTDICLKEIFSNTFNLKFDEARAQLAGLKHQAEAHPLVALAAVVLSWWEISVKILEVDPVASEPFLNASEECMGLAEEMIARGDKKGEGDLVLGTTLGLMSRWSAANRAWFPAYTRGNRSARYCERALRKNPRATDAYMTLGTFNYAREVLRNLVSGTQMNNSKKAVSQGIAQLKKASKEGTYFKEASSLLLAGLLTNENPSEAIPLLQELKAQMPENGFVTMVLISAFYNAGQTGEMKVEIDQFFEKISSGTYSHWFISHAYFARGLSSFREQHWKEAIGFFSDAIDNGNESNPYFTWAHLYQGYAWDALGERRKAKKLYEKVLALQRRFASHDHARDRLSKPFKPTDPEMKKLEL